MTPSDGAGDRRARDDAFDVAARPRGLPDPAAHGPRQAAGLSRQRGHDAEAAAPCSTPSSRTTRDDQREHPSRRPRAERAGDRRLRGRARDASARSSTRLAPARSSSRATPPRGSTSSRRRFGRSRLTPGDEVLISAMEHHSNIVPWQLRLRGRRARGCASRRSTTAASCSSTSSSGCCRPRTQDRRDHAHVERARHGHPGRRDRPARARRRASRCCSTASQAASHMPRRRAGARLRLLRRHRPQAVRPDRHRRALRQDGAARGDAAVHGRRRHDQLGDLREDDLERAAVQVRGGHAEHRRRDRAAARRSTTSTAIGLDAIAAHEHDLLDVRRPRRSQSIAGRAPHRHGAAQGRASCRS